MMQLPKDTLWQEYPLDYQCTSCGRFAVKRPLGQAVMELNVLKKRLNKLVAQYMGAKNV